MCLSVRPKVWHRFADVFGKMEHMKNSSVWLIMRNEHGFENFSLTLVFLFFGRKIGCCNFFS